VHEDAEPASAFDKSSDVTPASRADNEIALPVAGYEAIFHIAGAFFDRQWMWDSAKHKAITRRLSARAAESSARSEARHHVSFDRAARLRVDGSVDRFVADPHAFIRRELDSQSMADLLWGPPPVEMLLNVTS
jgi:hypothetical protein